MERDHHETPCCPGVILTVNHFQHSSDTDMRYEYITHSSYVGLLKLCILTVYFITHMYFKNLQLSASSCGLMALLEDTRFEVSTA